MDNQKKAGITLIVIGICIPLMALPFVSGYEKDKGLWNNYYSIGIKIKKDTQGEGSKIADGSTGDQASKKSFFSDRIIPQRIPFRLFLIPMFILLYIGIVTIDKARSRARKDTANVDNEE